MFYSAPSQGDDLGRYTVCVKDTKRKQLVLMANTAAKQRGVRWAIPVHAFRRKVVSPGGFFSKIILVVYSCIAYPVWFLVFLFKACHLVGFAFCLICYIYKLSLKFIFIHFPAVYCILSHFYFAMVPVVSMRSDLPRNRNRNSFFPSFSYSFWLSFLVIVTSSHSAFS